VTPLLAAEYPDFGDREMTEGILEHNLQYLELPIVEARPIQLPHFFWFALGLLMGITVITMSIIVLVRRELMDPFAAYEDLFGDDVRQAALAIGFTCTDTGLPSQTENQSSYCDQLNPDGVFSSLALQFIDDRADEISFWLREHTLALGDLELLWGEPEIQQYCEVVVFSWHNRHLTGIAEPSRTGRIDIFVPIVSITLTHVGLPQREQLLLTNVTPC
jgi:hypothetical protein